MWTCEHTIDTTASPAALWKLYSDVSTWPTWHGDNESRRSTESSPPGRVVS